MSIDWKAIWWRAWLERLFNETRAECAESNPVRDEWSLGPCLSTAPFAKVAVAALIGSIRIEWRRESDHWLIVRDWRVRRGVAR